MTEPAWDIYAEAPRGEAQMRDYFALLKPRVMSLVVFTAAVGMLIAPVGVHPVIAFASILCIAAGAGASGALNMWWDADIDALMRRTASRPVPAGRVAPDEALGLGVGLALISVMSLFLFANPLAAGILAFTIFYYAVIYTVWLKRLTPQNIVIGGAAGAFPPLIGWAVATGGLSIEPVLLFAIIFMWTPPHFWALALFADTDYRRAGVPMMPAVAGAARTRVLILGYALVLAPIAILPAFTAIGGPLYLAAALVLNLRFVLGAWRLARRDEAAARADGFAVEKSFFGLSIVYLFAHFLALLAEAGLGAAGLRLADWPQLL
ncbi:MAG: protoheme IX farnesyltransferase [Alphaproteobacteria bacterium]|nr:MAG: protoheme IX farnesyltransferase [Alphaproteobacteria bacterium]